uniref:O-antigen ligase-related domain-containing protein n=1 Tax=Desertifilum tharense IPPAS B-1220 TaxID=1781255 RepID=A0A1E5QF02_9CYAN|nr:hypothetical protein BH720_20780 [Desertifilum tharense IPPAS B-1220]
MARSRSHWLSRPLHSDPRLNRSWLCLQIVLATVMFSPVLAAPFSLWIVWEVWRKQWRQLCRSGFNRGLAVVSVLLILSAVLAENPGEAALGLFNFLPFFLIFVTISPLLQTPHQLRRIAWILVFTSIPIIAIGFGQLFWGWSGPVRLLWSAIDWPLDPGGAPLGRMASVFAYANVLANYLAVTFTLALGLWIEAIDKTRYPWVSREVWGLSGVVLGNAIALILTNSRNAWAIALLVSLAFAVYLGWRWLIAALGAVGAAIGGAAFAPAPINQALRAVVPAYFWARLTDQLYPDRPFAQLRATQWQFAWEMMQQRPLLGWGLRNFTPIYQAQMDYWVGHPHNLFLMLLAETGLPATLLFCTLVGWIVGRAVWHWHHWDRKKSGQLIGLTFLLAFGGFTLFHLFDVTIFDARVNYLGWVLLASLRGVIVWRDRSV